MAIQHSIVIIYQGPFQLQIMSRENNYILASYEDVVIYPCL